MICGVPPRAFAHHAITELPPAISREEWAPSLLRVLERATQTRPGARYQRVQDFWEDLNDTSLPATRPLQMIQARRNISADLQVESEVITAPPPKPRFETSSDLQHQEIAGNGATRPKIVVPIAAHAAAQAMLMPSQGFGVPQQTGRVTVPVTRNGRANRPVQGNIGVQPRKRSRDFVVGVVLVLCFAGLLLATGAYVRSWIKARTAEPTTITTSLVGRDALTTTDVNLRAGPNSTSSQVGLAEAGSRVRVTNVNSNSSWCEVQILQHARPKADPASEDRGWVNRRYLKFD
jgi:hypothetical protein